MNIFKLLTRSKPENLTPEEEEQLTRELSDAYHMDEAAATSEDVERIVAKVRERVAKLPGVHLLPHDE